jgi:hypothetical protein
MEDPLRQEVCYQRVDESGIAEVELTQLHCGRRRGEFRACFERVAARRTEDHIASRQELFGKQYTILSGHAGDQYSRHS